MAKRVRVLLVCFILLILAGLLRIQLSYEDTSDHQGRGPPSVLVKGDSKKLAADQIEKRYTSYYLHVLYTCTIKVDLSRDLSVQLQMFDQWELNKHRSLDFFQALFQQVHNLYNYRRVRQKLIFVLFFLLYII